MNRYALAGQERSERLRHVERGCLRNGVGGYDRQRSERRERQVVDDCTLGTFQQRQERLRHFQRTQEVDGQVPFDYIEITQIVVDGDAGIVDEDVQGVDFGGRSLDLRNTGHVQRQGSDMPVKVGEDVARSGIHSFRASPQGFFYQRLSDTAIGPSYQN